MRKIIPAIVGGATALAVAGGAFGYATVDKDVTLSVDGAQTEVSTFSSTVGDVLEAKGIKVSDHDVVAPALDAKVNDGTRIAVQYGRQVTVSVDGTPQTFWTTATNVEQALSALTIDTTGADLTTSRNSSIGRNGLEFGVSTRKDVTITVAGKKKVVQTTGLTLAEALTAAKIKVDADDLLTIAPKAAAKPAKKGAKAPAPVKAKATDKLTDGAAFVFVKVDKKTVKKTKKVDFDTIYKNSAKLDKGKTKVDAEGKTGVKTTSYAEVRHDGLVVSSKKGKATITTKPVDRVILVGTKEKPKKVERNNDDDDNNTSSNSNSNSSSNNAPSVANGSVWDRLAQCESGGNWAINTGNGFYGGLQFTLQTWRGFGGSGMPNHASREQQIAVAKRVQASQGWGAWPACTSRLGIR